MNKKKLIIPVLCFAFLCGCSANKSEVEEFSTTIESTSTTNATNTTAPTAQAVAELQDLSTEKIVWGPGNITDHQQPNDPVLLQKQFQSFNANWLMGDDRYICLTFDAGYENGYTSQILDTLKEKQVQAIFFVTYDYVKDNPDLVQRMIDDGHIVGNHSYHHYSMDEISEDLAKEEVMFLHEYMQENFDYTMNYFRFPKGEFSEQSLEIVNELGYKSVFWSYAYADWDTDNQPDETKAFTSICESTHSGEIMLLHAVSKTNADILGNVIDDIEQQGYIFSTSL